MCILNYRKNPLYKSPIEIREYIHQKTCNRMFRAQRTAIHNSPPTTELYILWYILIMEWGKQLTAACNNVNHTDLISNERRWVQKVCIK